MYTRKSLSNNRQARQKGKYIMKKTFYKYTNKFLISMQMNTKKQIKNLNYLNCKMKLELRNWDKGACPFIPIRAAASPYSQFFV